MPRITAELSLYPMGGNPIARVIAFISELEGSENVEIIVNQLSTQMRGELADVLALVGRATERAFAAGGPDALVVKILNADLPIGEPPDLTLRT